jgi:hypothetical protein
MLRFMAKEVTLKQVYLPLLRGFPVSIIPQMPHLHPDLDLTRRTTGKSLRGLPKIRALSDIDEGKHRAVKVFSICF